MCFAQHIVLVRQPLHHSGLKYFLFIIAILQTLKFLKLIYLLYYTIYYIQM